MHLEGRFLIALCGLSISAAHADPGSRWNFAYNNGIAEYSTGIWDAPTGGALNLSCQDRHVTIVAQIKGKTPPPNSQLLLTIADRAGTRQTTLAANETGSTELPVAAPVFTALWAALRSGNIVTVTYSDGRSSVLSLDGAAAALPPKPCG